MVATYSPLESDFDLSRPNLAAPVAFWVRAQRDPFRMPKNRSRSSPTGLSSWHDGNYVQSPPRLQRQVDKAATFGGNGVALERVYRRQHRNVTNGATVKTAEKEEAGSTAVKPVRGPENRRIQWDEASLA